MKDALLLLSKSTNKTSYVKKKQGSLFPSSIIERTKRLKRAIGPTQIHTLQTLLCCDSLSNFFSLSDLMIIYWFYRFLFFAWLSWWLEINLRKRGKPRTDSQTTHKSIDRSINSPSPQRFSKQSKNSWLSITRKNVKNERFWEENRQVAISWYSLNI